MHVEYHELYEHVTKYYQHPGLKGIFLRKLPYIILAGSVLDECYQGCIVGW